MSGQVTFIGEGSSSLYRPPSLESVQRIRPGLAGNERCGNLRKADRLWRPRKEKASSLAAPARQKTATNQKVRCLRKVWVRRPESLGGLGDRNPEGMAPSGQKEQPYAVVQHHGHGGLLAFAVGQLQKALRIGDGEFLPPALDDTL